MLISKYFITFLLFSTQLFAGHAVVIVLETALLRDRSPKAKVVQLVRKNQVIWIHDREFGLSPLKPDYDTMNDRSEFNQLRKIRYDQGEIKAGFVESMDRNGQAAYVRKSHIKFLYKDDRESLSNVNPFINDPTDYRLEEPLPDDYPLTDPEKRKAFLHIIFGPAHRSRFTYAEDIASTDRGLRKGFATGYGRKVGWDMFNRFYFGGYGHFTISETNYTFPNSETEARELVYQIAVGPFLSYDVFRKESWKLAIGGGINFNWNRHFVKLTDDNIGEEERNFEGINFSPRAFAEYHIRNFIIPGADIVFGIDMQFQLAQDYSSGPAHFPELWPENEDAEAVYRTPTGGVLTYMIGFQSNY